MHARIESCRSLQRRSIAFALAGGLALGFSASPAAAIPFTLNANPSQLALIVDVSIFGGALTATTQCTGCLVTKYDGTLQATPAGLSGVQFDGGGAADARTQVGFLNSPRAISPAPGGASGTGPADYGVTLSAPVGTELPPIEIPNFGTLNLGTLQSIDVDVALRNVVLDVTSTSFLPVMAGSFDPTGTTIALFGDMDLNAAFVLKAPDLTTYFVNLVALTALASSAPELGIGVTGNLLAREISVGLGFGVPFGGVQVANQATTPGTLSAVGNVVTLALPVNVDATPSALAGVIDVGINLQGQLVGVGTVPEPSSLLLSGLGLAWLGACRRSRTAR